MADATSATADSATETPGRTDHADSPAVEFDGVTKRYGDVIALDDVSLSIPSGTVFGLLGPNGAGKTTLLDLLLGFTRPTTGTVRVFGRDVRNRSAVQGLTGALAERADAYDRLTGREHVRLAADAEGVSVAPVQVLERVGLAAEADRRAGTYSKGMTRRLLLAVALVGAPDVLVLDEPTAGLDPDGARTVRTVVADERARGATVLFSSHHLAQVEAVANRVGVLREGRLVANDTVDALRHGTDSMEEVYLRYTADRTDSPPEAADRGGDRP